MRAKEFIIETAMMGKIADSGKIIRILKKAHTVPFSDEKNWLLVDTDPGKGNSGLGIKWISADTRFEWVRPYKDSVDENLSPQTIHKLADHKGVKWDNEPSFLQLTKRLTGKEHLDDLDQAGLNKVKKHLDGLQGVAEEINSDVFNPAFNDTQIFDELTYRATAEEVNDKTYFQVKVLDSNFQQVGLAKFSPTKRGLVSAMTWVHPEYQGQGLARNIYAYVRSLGNTIAPSRNQLPPGKAMWASWKKSGDAKYLMNDVAEGLNEFAQGNGGDDGESFDPDKAKMAYDHGFGKGVALADGSSLATAFKITRWDQVDGGLYKQHFVQGFKEGRMDKINHDNKQYNLDLKLMKDGSIRHGEQDVAENFADGRNTEKFLGEYPSIETKLGEGTHPDLVKYNKNFQKQLHRDLDVGQGKGKKTDIDYDSDEKGWSDLTHVQDYTGGSLDTNDYLHRQYRNKAKAKELTIHQAKIQAMDRILANNKLPQQIVVYTGLRQSPAEAWETYKADVTKPIRLHLPAYTSTTTKLKVALEHAGEGEITQVSRARHPPRNKDAPGDEWGTQILMMTLPAGLPAASVKKISEWPDENEILLPRGIDIEINPNPTVLRDGDYVWHAKVLSHSPVQIASPMQENFADDSAEAYRAHLIKTLPQIIKLFANIGKGWIPSKEQMLSAVDTAYTVMKHTGDAKQAGKVLMDELNALYRMSQGTQDVAENFADGRNPEDKGDSKRHGINTKASVSSLRKTAKSGGRKGQLAHWLANMKSGRAKAKSKNETIEQGVAEGRDPDKKYTIKKSYTMSTAGVEKSVWYIMDGDFVVDATDLRRDAKYYADKWNAAEKDSKNA